MIESEMITELRNCNRNHIFRAGRASGRNIWDIFFPKIVLSAFQA